MSVEPKASFRRHELRQSSPLQPHKHTTRLRYGSQDSQKWSWWKRDSQLSPPGPQYWASQVSGSEHAKEASRSLDGRGTGLCPGPDRSGCRRRLSPVVFSVLSATVYFGTWTAPTPELRRREFSPPTSTEIREYSCFRPAHSVSRSSRRSRAPADTGGPDRSRVLRRCSI